MCVCATKNYLTCPIPELERWWYFFILPIGLNPKKKETELNSNVNRTVGYKWLMSVLSSSYNASGNDDDDGALDCGA